MGEFVFQITRSVHGIYSFFLENKNAWGPIGAWRYHLHFPSTWILREEITMIHRPFLSDLIAWWQHPPGLHSPPIMRIQMPSFPASLSRGGSLTGHTNKCNEWNINKSFWMFFKVLTLILEGLCHCEVQ